MRRQAAPVRGKREREVERLPVGVGDDVERHRSAADRDREASRVVRAIRPVERHAMPVDPRRCQQLLQRHVDRQIEQLLGAPARRDQRRGEAQHAGLALDGRPVEPAELVVLAVGVVVPVLAAQHLVAHGQHRHADGEQGQRQEVLRLAAAQLDDGGIVGRALGAAIPAEVVVAPVAVVLAVRLVVLAVVADQVGEGEPVVAGDEVDRLLRLAIGVRVQVRAADQPLAHGPDAAGIAAHEPTHVIPEAAVPLHPAVAHERADLVQPGGVPRLGDQLRPGQHRVAVDVPQDRRPRQRPAVLVA